MANLNLPSLKKSGNKNTTGEHGPDPVEVTNLPLVTNHEHTHTIHKLTNNTAASEFASAKK